MFCKYILNKISVIKNNFTDHADALLSHDENISYNNQHSNTNEWNSP